MDVFSTSSEEEPRLENRYYAANSRDISLVPEQTADYVCRWMYGKTRPHPNSGTIPF
jgi:hypothetical protein